MYSTCYDTYMEHTIHPFEIHLVLKLYGGGGTVLSYSLVSEAPSSTSAVILTTGALLHYGLQPKDYRTQVEHGTGLSCRHALVLPYLPNHPERLWTKWSPIERGSSNLKTSMLTLQAQLDADARISYHLFLSALLGRNGLL